VKKLVIASMFALLLFGCGSKKPPVTPPPVGESPASVAPAAPSGPKNQVALTDASVKAAVEVLEIWNKEGKSFESIRTDFGKVGKSVEVRAKWEAIAQSAGMSFEQLMAHMGKVMMAYSYLKMQEGVKSQGETPANLPPEQKKMMEDMKATMNQQLQSMRQGLSDQEIELVKKQVARLDTLSKNKPAKEENEAPAEN